MKLKDYLKEALAGMPDAGEKRNQTWAGMPGTPGTSQAGGGTATPQPKHTAASTGKKAQAGKVKTAGKTDKGSKDAMENRRKAIESQIEEHEKAIEVLKKSLSSVK